MNLSINKLLFKHGKYTILNDVSVSLSGSQVVTLLGPNGAGKSTLLKVLAATLHCHKGKVALDEFDAESQRPQYLQKIGYMPENAVVIAELTVLEQLQLFAHSQKVKNPQKAIQGVVEICQLARVVDKRCNKLSLGFKQRLNLAQALLNKPQVLIMDEPLNGLDPHLIIEFRKIIGQLKNDTLIIMSTHYLAEAQLISDRVLIMQEGKLLDNIDLKNNMSADFATNNFATNSFDLEKIYMQHTLVDV